MKRILNIINILVILGTSFNSNALPVSKERAMLQAADFFAQVRNATKSSGKDTPSIKYLGSYPLSETKAENRAPSMYIFEEDAGGYVVVSGDDCSIPILGYSLTGRFPMEDIPDNMAALLGWYDQIIEHARSIQFTTSSSRKVSVSPSELVQLETATWGQDYPYNALCPTIEGEKCPSGCVATAISIIMRYHKWPQRGQGILPSYDYEYNGKTYHMDGHELGYEYLWDKMPLSPPYTDEEASQIAQLLYDVGIMVQMDYAPFGSGAHTELATKLVRFFNYDRGIKYYSRSSFHESEWEAIIKNEIDSSRPILYSGSNGLSFHAYVIDGYCGDYFSFNFGWDGSNNGLFTLRPIEGDDESLITFYHQQNMVYGIQPASSSTVSSIYAVGTGIGIMGWDYNLDVSFPVGYSFDLRGIYEEDRPQSFDFCFFITDKNGERKEMISSVITLSTDQMSVSPFGYEDVLNGHLIGSCKITGTIDDGDSISLFWKSGEGEWERVLPQSRDYSFVFNTAPLVELVKIGITRENPAPDAADNWWSYIDGFEISDKVFYIYGYKDIFWEILDANKQAIDLHNPSSGIETMSPVSRKENEDYYIRLIKLPAGDYILRLKNINDELKVKIKL